MSRTLYGHHIETIKGEDYVLHEDYTELQNKYYKQKEVLDKIKKYVKNDYDRNQEVVDYCGFDKFYNHILKLLEEIDEKKI